MKFLLASLLSIFLLGNICFAQQTIKINNLLPRTTTAGKIVDAHDGRIIKFGNTYYWYGTQYGSTNGFTTANTYVVYYSTNMSDWVFGGPLLQNAPAGVYYRPHVVYNKKTKKYVLWYNWNPKLWDGQFGVATSNNPTGPFTIVNNNVKVKNSALGVGDLGVFIDADEKAYLSYNTINGHKLSVEALNQTYTESTLQGSNFIAENCEAGGMFKKNNTYYLLTDYTCCFCTQGSGAQVFTAPNPLGPYTYKQNINRHPGTPLALATDGKMQNNNYDVIDTKNNEYIEIEVEGNEKLNQIKLFQFTGNRSGQCGEVNNPILHQAIPNWSFKLQIFTNGQWQSLSTKQIQQAFSQQTTYTITFQPLQTSKLRIYCTTLDSIKVLQLNELVIGKKNNFTVYKSNGSLGKPIIPAQQTFLMPLQTNQGTQYLWMGDLWGSASDGVKGHDYQFWSEPLQFDNFGFIKPIRWVDKFTIKTN
jgi:hypothetical protein